MQMPSSAAMNIVDRFSWSSNVMRDGRLIGQQYLVAEAIDQALAVRDAEIARLRKILFEVQANQLNMATNKRRRVRALRDNAMFVRNKILAALDEPDQQGAPAAS